MSKKMFSDRKKYRMAEVVVIILIGILAPSIWIIGMTVFQLQSDAIFVLQLIAVISGAVLFFLFKRWAKAEDERVFLLSQKAARKTIYFFGVTLVVLCMIFIWVSNKSIEGNSGEHPFDIVIVNHTNISLPIQNGSGIVIINSSISNAPNFSGSQVNPDPWSLTIEIMSPTSAYVNYPANNKNAIPQFYGDVAITLLMVAVALWLTYLIFYYYYGRKYGEFGRDHEE